MGGGQHAPLGQDVPRTVGSAREEQGTEGKSLSSLLHFAPGTLICSKRGFILWTDEPTRECTSFLVHLDSESVTVRFTQLSGFLFFLRSRPTTHWKNTRSRMRSPSARRLQCVHMSMATACGHRTESLTPRCFRRLCPQWVNSSNCGKPRPCHGLFDLQGLCKENERARSRDRSIPSSEPAWCLICFTGHRHTLALGSCVPPPPPPLCPHPSPHVHAAPQPRLAPAHPGLPHPWKSPGKKGPRTTQLRNSGSPLGCGEETPEHTWADTATLWGGERPVRGALQSSEEEEEEQEGEREAGGGGGVGGGVVGWGWGWGWGVGGVCGGWWGWGKADAVSGR